MLITNYLAAVPEMVPFSIDASFSAAMHSTSRLAAAGRSSGASKETQNGCWKKMAPLHQLEANTFMPGSPSPGSDLSELRSSLKIGVWSVDAGVQKTAFERQVNGESFWCHVNVSDEALETSICARCCQGGQHGRSSPWKCRQSWTEKTDCNCWLGDAEKGAQQDNPSIKSWKETHTHTYSLLPKHLFMGL